MILDLLYRFFFFFFFLMIPPPPTSTLFPYTTLFRSRRLRFTLGNYKGPCLIKTLKRRVVKGINFTQDRKSTRLNSSHVSISYAVFCLKKKKKKIKTKHNNQY